MIEVTYYREHNRLTVKGHAQSDVYGKDLVCAACSILTAAMGANINRMVECGCAGDPVIRLEEGNAEISCRPARKFRAVVRQSFASVCVGYQILAQKCPEYISFSVRG